MSSEVEKSSVHTSQLIRPKWILLDRDGTLIVERNYLKAASEVELLPGAAAALRQLASLGIRFVVVTNQSGVGRGYFTQQDLDRIHEKLTFDLATEGVDLAGIYVCPHVPSTKCQCRKPSPGLFFQAVADHGIATNECFIVGDKECDIELARAVGAKGVLVRTGYGAMTENTISGDDVVICEDLSELAKLIVDGARE